MANSDKMEHEKELVRAGFAWRYVRYDRAGEFTDAECDARAKRRGLVGGPDSGATVGIQAGETTSTEQTAVTYPGRSSI